VCVRACACGRAGVCVRVCVSQYGITQHSCTSPQDNPAAVTVHDESRHGLEDGDEVIFDEIRGMRELNGIKPAKVTVTGTTTVAHCAVQSISFCN